MVRLAVTLGGGCEGAMLANGSASMASKSDELEEQLRQNLRLRSQLATEIAKARDGNARLEPASSAQASIGKHHAPQSPPRQLAPAEHPQGAGWRAVFWVLIGAVITGLALGVVFEWIPTSWKGRL